jgi:hypothetical protein
VRAEIEALEHELARLEPHFADRRAAERASGGQGARLVTARELEATRDELAARVSARRRELRAARTAARSGSAKTRAGASEWRPRPSGPSPASAWPELLASAR